MADVAITKKPDRKATYLGAPVREGNGSYKMTAKWTVPARLTDGKCNARCTGWEVRWQIRIKLHAKNQWKTLTWSYRYADPKRKEHALYLSNFTCTDKRNYTRNSFYPNTDWLLQSATILVRPFNNKGNGEWAKATRTFVRPRKPSITVEQDAESGRVTYKVTHNKGEDYAENYDTRVIARVYDSALGKDTNQRDGSFRSTSESYSNYYDVRGRMLQTYDQYYTVKVTAVSRGFWGNSEWVYKEYHVSWPMQPTILGVLCPSTATDGKVTVRVDTNYDPGNKKGVEHPVTGIKLEKLVNVDYTEESQIPGDANWEATESVDNGLCYALSTTVALLQPEAGKTTWVRVKAWNEIEGVFYRYSKPVRVTALEVPAPTAADDEVTIASAVSQPGGKGAILRLAWNADDSTGTLVEYSDDEHAWESNKRPEADEVTWYESVQTTVGDVTYDRAATFYVNGLTEGARYFFKAMRYLDDENGKRTLGKVSETRVVVPSSAPRAATLNAPPFVPRGSALSLSWTVDSDAEQTMWEVLTGPTHTTSGPATDGGIEHLWIDETKARVVASGEGPSGSAVMASARLAEMLGDASSVPLAVRVGTGGGSVTSEAVVVEVADRPTVALTIPETVATRRPTFDVECSTAANVAIVVTACGVEHDHPDGSRQQPAGDTVWSAALTPEWTEVTDDETVTGYSATITAPEDMQVYDHGSYDVLVRAEDSRTGLESDDATGTFDVAFARSVPMPPDSIVVTPYDVTDEDGAHSMGATIALAAADGMVETDAYDVYRLTPDGATLIASGRGATDEVTDPYAPFGEDVVLAYRISCRTADGLEEWRDYEYDLPCGLTRIDWDGGYLELPYNLQLTESWEKDFEARRHLDGSIDGYWNVGAQRTATITTDFRKAFDADATEAMRELANHCGPCLVRTQTGLCFMADVQPSSHQWTYDGAALNTSFNVTEVALADGFAALVPEVQEGS